MVLGSLARLFQVASGNLALSASVLLEGMSQLSCLLMHTLMHVCGVEFSPYVAPLGFLCQIPNSGHSVSHIGLKPSGVILDLFQDGSAVGPKNGVSEG